MTASGVATAVITEHAVFRFEDDGLVLTESLDDASLDDVAAETSATYTIRLDPSP